VCDLCNQHVLRGVGGFLHVVPGERGVGGGERLAGILLLQIRIRARGGRVRLSDMQPRHVQQPARAHGVLELLARAVLRGCRRDRERDVPGVPAGSMVARGQPEL
jgi:hypothetical protein